MLTVGISVDGDVAVINFSAMAPIEKQVTDLTEADLRSSPIWTFASNDQGGELLVLPAPNIPRDDLTGCVIGLDVTLANSSTRFAMLGNVSLKNSRWTEQFLAAKFAIDQVWVPLARYFDGDWSEHGPSALAAKLGLPESEVFPIAYDLSNLGVGPDEALGGVILASPNERLSDDELVDLISCR